MYQPIENEIFHVHTWRCGHAGEEQDYEYVEKAIALGVKRIVFTDHCPFPGDFFFYRMKMEQLSDYVASIKQLKEKYGMQIEILCGLEIEYLPSFLDYYKELKASGDYDLFLLGQHLYEAEDGRWSFKIKDLKDEYVGLFHAMIEGAKTGLFDVIAHPDRCFRGCREWTDGMTAAAKELVATAIDKGLYLEKNYTSMQTEYLYWDKFWEYTEGAKILNGLDAHSVETMENFWRKSLE